MRQIDVGAFIFEMCKYNAKLYNNYQPLPRERERQCRVILYESLWRMRVAATTTIGDILDRTLILIMQL